MGTKEIQSDDWNRLCEQITEHRRDALLTIELLRPDGTKIEVVRDEPLQRVILAQEPCNDVIRVQVGPADLKPITHEIIEPIHIKLKPAENGHYNPLQIEAESGTTLVTFHPALRAEVVGGLASRG